MEPALEYVSRSGARRICALEAEAEVIASSDDDLLTFGRHRDIAILSIAQMLHRLSATNYTSKHERPSGLK